ncbi:MAG: primosomal protein N' (replication factor Y) - superfamily II helicase [Thiofilum sp.]|uniref:primosomal protein N' (replication factor Y) - superfamily II helicase n=1 Tax=Thiofilum sp. TaxID=2212733 RepID=UPI0025DCEF42|nr:primosomal protein N' (replication factor Y) - superfamily II helicase [Thiofilum sp.]MBK8452003.1 primosomal protein N' (replication factor Y) - superfamily II helicase [Thiofilum sp.]
MVQPVQATTEQRFFHCESCGSNLIYHPGTTVLKCTHCGHENVIEPTGGAIKEYSFSQALRQLEQSKLKVLDNTEVIKCPNCAATFELDNNRHAGDCPFCGTPVVTSTAQARLFQPKSLLPFVITEKQAKTSFDNWINKLWFAPSALKNKARRDEKLLGIYVPYWTYDSYTDTDYTGQRGTIYYEREYVTVMVNGQPRQEIRNVAKIRWQPVSGHVRLFFDDVLVGATQTLPRTILDQIEPWDLDNLVSYQEAYLSGFTSELYQIDLDEGFDNAKQIMNERIEAAIRRDIGGDQQMINRTHTNYSQTTFKHLLLPVWSAAFRYNEKIYRFVINGRNGKTKGERPYSKVKIAFALLAGFMALGALIYYLEASGALNQMMEYGVPSSTYYYYR